MSRIPVAYSTRATVANTVPPGWSLASSGFVTPNMFVDAIAGVVYYRHGALYNWKTTQLSDINPANRHASYTQVNWRHHQLLVGANPVPVNVHQLVCWATRGPAPSLLGVMSYVDHFDRFILPPPPSLANVHTNHVQEH
jgi:hypothetical protein